MTIEKIFEMVNELAPNNCTEKQKLYWYNQCESIIAGRAMKRYRYIETMLRGGVVKLPDGYCSEDIESIYINGKKVDKLDFRSGFGKKNITEPMKIGVVLKEHHREVEIKEFSGEMLFDESTVTMNGHPFVSGDEIKISCPLFEGRVTVLGTSGDIVYISRNCGTGRTEGSVQTTLNIDVALNAPYDRLYIDYIMAQMDYYNKDFEGYNNSSYMFNELLSELVLNNSQKAPGNKGAQMVGIW